MNYIIASSETLSKLDKYQSLRTIYTTILTDIESYMMKIPKELSSTDAIK